MSVLGRIAMLGGATVAGVAAYAQQIQQTSCKAEASGDHHNVLIIGAGTGGVTVATQLMRDSRKPTGMQVTMVEPAKTHYYQPMWTMIGGGMGFTKEQSGRPMSDIVPSNVNHVQEGVKTFQPEKNAVVLESGKTLTYDFLVMSPGLKMDWDKIQGLRAAIDDPACPVASIYDGSTAEKTDRIMKEFKGGEALFTQPACPIKCGGAPQKVMWLQESIFRERGIRGATNVSYFTNLPAMFHVKKYGDALNAMAVEKNVNAHFQTDLIKIDKDKRIATFQHLETKEVTTKKFDVLHVTPYMSPPDVVKKSPLAGAAGFIDVDKVTLQHTKFDNVFALGDASSLPTSKTAASITMQAPVLVSNLIHKMKGEEMTGKYDGYTSCPILVGDGKLMLAEFLYDLKVQETFPWDQSKPSVFFYYVKRDFFPWVYWNSFVKGTWYGKNTWIYPSAAK
eukprot:CAMPEP_0181323494 /NCGR_PEP_ID=MMETSP1101-20121128/19823_1 /TAXON_ID=46948 /ORGANISM="Rhodomonas abbreviata, Strain Caron Lab Isolate" /LENGTH=448 /DNA_ID=CAMNT_0023431541 /DNA_START=8 /DNA_END=1354 /DNA_ORIENTATION=+